MMASIVSEMTTTSDHCPRRVMLVMKMTISSTKRYIVPSVAVAGNVDRGLRDGVLVVFVFVRQVFLAFLEDEDIVLGGDAFFVRDIDAFHRLRAAGDDGHVVVAHVRDGGEDETKPKTKRATSKANWNAGRRRLDR